MMKISSATLATALLVALAVPAFPADSASKTSEQGSDRVEVSYKDPEKFTDVKDSSMGSDRDRENYLSLLKTHLEERGAKEIPDGAKLSVTISDVDMAGDFEPWRGPQFNDVRVVKEIYPPRIHLTFKLTGSDGSVLKEGERKLSDLSFQMNATPAFSNDSLKYEKSLLDNWLRSEFTDVKTAKEKK
jgi:hypothetical protein